MKTKEIFGISSFLTILFGLGFLLVYLFGGHISQVSNTTFSSLSGQYLFTHDLGFSISRAWDIIAFWFYAVMIIKIFVFLQDTPAEGSDNSAIGFMAILIPSSLFFAFGYPFLVGGGIGFMLMLLLSLAGFEERGLLAFFLVSMPITLIWDSGTFFGPGLSVGLVEGLVLSSIIYIIYYVMRKIFWK